MTLLAVDIGNSQTVLATFEGDQRVGSWRVTTAPRATSDELRLLWRGLIRDAEITGVAACSTVPALLPGEQVAIVDVTNGARLETYVIPGERGTGVIGINGAAAHLVHPGDLVIMISYGVMDETEAKSYIPRVVHVDGANRIVELGGDPAAPSPGVLGQRRGDVVDR